MRRSLPWAALVLAVGALWLSGAGDAARPLAEAAGEARAAAEGPTTPSPERSYTLRQGETLFLHYCATCHGAEGRGDGFNAYSLDPKPRDLADPQFHRERSDEELASIIRTGGGAVGLSNNMPPWGRTVSERQIDQLVAYIRLLPTMAEDGAAEE